MRCTPTRMWIQHVIRAAGRALLLVGLIPLLLSGQLPVAHANWLVAAGVLPNPMHATTRNAELLLKTHVGAICTARIEYKGVKEKSLSFRALTVKASGRAQWTWHVNTKARQGQATVTCRYQGHALSAVAYFTIKHP